MLLVLIMFVKIFEVPIKYVDPILYTTKKHSVAGYSNSNDQIFDYPYFMVIISHDYYGITFSS